MTGIMEAFVFSGLTEGLAGTGGSADGPILRPTREPERLGPAADAREEMVLRVSDEIGRVNLFDPAFVNVARWDELVLNEHPEPRRFFGVIVIVVVHAATPALGFFSSRS